MRSLIKAGFLFWIAFAVNYCNAAAIILNEKDATVWLPDQLITGRITGAPISVLKLYCNGFAYRVDVDPDHTFKLMVKLMNGKNKLWASGEHDNLIIRSEPLNLTLGYHMLPVIKPFAVIKGNKAILNATTINNPTNHPLKYSWTAADNNPAHCQIQNKNSRVSPTIIPDKNGTYYFNLLVTSSTDSACFKTYVVRSNDALHAYDIDKDHAAWIHKAVIYEITPTAFVTHGLYDDITAKLAELRTLGINTLWLQPVYKTDDRGQGYSVTDYFSLRPDLGTEKQLGNLITTAKKMHIRVMFDFVPNHTSINHPYALDCIKYGDSSHYYSYYQHNNDGKPYSSFYHKDKNGFVVYFWGNLVNLDYNNKEVQQWMIEAAKYWLTKFDIDGYRFDTMWGPNARCPQFAKRLETELKSIKPDLLLLAEDKASDKTVSASGFDAAYDWTPDTAWISQWSLQTEHHINKSSTIFNSPDTSNRKSLLEQALFHNGNAPIAVLRFIENNDVPRFIDSHSLKQTKLAAALLFALPGIPMIFNGQEIGSKLHPYSSKPIFKRANRIVSADSLHLFSYYQELIRIRLSYPALLNATLQEIPVTNNHYVLGFHRWKNDEHFFILLNLKNSPTKAVIDIGNDEIVNRVLSKNVYALDILSKNRYVINKNGNTKLQVPIEAYGIRWLLLKNQ